MRFNGGGLPFRAIWTYGYVLIPPIPRIRLGPMEALLSDGHAEAAMASRTWEGRLINGDDITHILVVSDRPEQNLGVNVRLEAELNRLKAPFAVTEALVIGDDP